MRFNKFLALLFLLAVFTLFFSSASALIITKPTESVPAVATGGETIEAEFVCTSAVCLNYTITVFPTGNPNKIITTVTGGPMQQVIIERPVYSSEIKRVVGPNKATEAIALPVGIDLGNHSIKVALTVMNVVAPYSSELASTDSATEQNAIIVPEPVHCGDGKCQEEKGETEESCPQDCQKEKPITCGNNVCDANENSANCPVDCKNEKPITCGNAVCEPKKGETTANCSEDCIVPADPNADSDNDALTDAEEIELGTNANDIDTDNDNVPDGEEAKIKTSMLKDTSKPISPTDPLDPKSNNLQTIVKEKEMGVGGTQQISVWHPELNSETQKNYPLWVSGTVKGAQTKVNLVSLDTGQSQEFSSSSDGIVSIPVTEGQFYAIVYNKKYASSAEFAALSTVTVMRNVIIDRGKVFFGPAIVDYPLFLILLLVAAALVAILAYSKAPSAFRALNVFAAKNSLQKLASVLLALVFFVIPVLVNKFSKVYFGLGIIVIEILLILLLVYWEKAKKQIEETKPMQVNR